MSSDKTDLWDNIGTALIILAICFGIGGCTYIDAIARVKIMQAQASHSRTNVVNTTYPTNYFSEQTGIVERVTNTYTVVTNIDNIVENEINSSKE